MKTKRIVIKSREEFDADTLKFARQLDRGEKVKTEKGEFKGVIMYFSTNTGTPFYLYKPIEITGYNEIEKWEEEMMDKYQSKDMTWIKNHYWKLEKISCVLILRNKKWFQDNIEQLGKVWDIILKERETGYEHRAPNKRVKKEVININNLKGCLLIKKVD